MSFTCLCQLNDMDTKSVTPVSYIPSDHVSHVPTRVILFTTIGTVCWSVSNKLHAVTCILKSHTGFIRFPS